MEYKRSEFFACPHCGTSMQEPVENFALAGAIGPASRARDTCYECNKEFIVQQIGKDDFVVTKATARRNPPS